MIGSSGIAAWIAQIAFWALILLGLGSGELRIHIAAVFVALWWPAYAGLSLCVRRSVPDTLLGCP